MKTMENLAFTFVRRIHHRRRRRHWWCYHHQVEEAYMTAEIGQSFQRGEYYRCVYCQQLLQRFCDWDIISGALGLHARVFNSANAGTYNKLKWTWRTVRREAGGRVYLWRAYGVARGCGWYRCDVMYACSCLPVKMWFGRSSVLKSFGVNVWLIRPQIRVWWAVLAEVVVQLLVYIKRREVDEASVLHWVVSRTQTCRVITVFRYDVLMCRLERLEW